MRLFRFQIFKQTATAIALLPALCLTHSVFADDWMTSRPDGHAPIMVMGEHTHGKGEWMLSYRYMYMEMSGMRNGTDEVTSTAVFGNNYTVTPTSMTMGMHMFGVMHAPMDRLTLMAMLPYTELEMDHTIFPGATRLVDLNEGSSGFTTRSDGIGDLKLTALYKIFEADHQTAHFNLGVSVPIGSIGEQDVIPGPGGRINRQLPAPMQLGSGSVDWMPGITYLSQLENWSWGVQANGLLRTDKNRHNYRLGHGAATTAWAARKVNSWLSVSPRIEYRYQGEISGQQTDLSLAPLFAPTRRAVTTAFSENYGGHTISVGAGANVWVPKGWLKGHRVAIESSFPVLQDLNGFQLETDWILTLGWQYAW